MSLNLNYLLLLDGFDSHIFAFFPVYLATLALVKVRAVKTTRKRGFINYKIDLFSRIDVLPERIVLIDFIFHVISFGQDLVGEVIVGVKEKM